MLKKFLLALDGIPEIIDVYFKSLMFTFTDMLINTAYD